MRSVILGWISVPATFLSVHPPIFPPDLIYPLRIIMTLAAPSVEMCGNLVRTGLVNLGSLGITRSGICERLATENGTSLLAILVTTGREKLKD